MSLYICWPEFSLISVPDSQLLSPHNNSRHTNNVLMIFIVVIYLIVLFVVLFDHKFLTLFDVDTLRQTISGHPHACEVTDEGIRLVRLIINNGDGCL